MEASNTSKYNKISTRTHTLYYKPSSFPLIDFGVPLAQTHQLFLIRPVVVRVSRLQPFTFWEPQLSRCQIKTVCGSRPFAQIPKHTLAHVAVHALDYRHKIRSPRCRALANLGGSVVRMVADCQTVYTIIAIFCQSCTSLQCRRMIDCGKTPTFGFCGSCGFWRRDCFPDPGRTAWVYADCHDALIPGIDDGQLIGWLSYRLRWEWRW